MTRGAADAVPAAFDDPDQIRAVATLLKQSRREIVSVINGTSMGRTLPQGVKVRITCGNPFSIRPGDVVAFLQAGQLIGHRVLAVGLGRKDARAVVITRGDASAVCDPPVPIDDVLGLVTGVEIREETYPVPESAPLPGWRGSLGWFVFQAVRWSLVIDPRFAHAVALSAKFASRIRLTVRHWWRSNHRTRA